MSNIGWYSQGLATCYFETRFGNVVHYEQLHDATKTLSDARRLYMRIELTNLERKKYQKNNQKTLKPHNNEIQQIKFGGIIMMTKEELKALYAKYKQEADDGTFASVLYDHLKRSLKDMGFEISLNCASVLFGTRRKKRVLYNYITITIKRGNEQYLTQRVDAIIDFIFDETRSETDLFNIIYNRV